MCFCRWYGWYGGMKYALHASFLASKSPKCLLKPNWCKNCRRNLDFRFWLTDRLCRCAEFIRRHAPHNKLVPFYIYPNKHITLCQKGLQDTNSEEALKKNVVWAHQSMNMEPSHKVSWPDSKQPCICAGSTPKREHHINTALLYCHLCTWSHIMSASVIQEVWTRQVLSQYSRYAVAEQ